MPCSSEWNRAKPHYSVGSKSDLILKMELENFQENAIVSNFLANLCVFFLTSSYCSLFPNTVFLSHYRSHVFLASDLLLQVFLYTVLSSTHIDLDAFHDTHCCKVSGVPRLWLIPLSHHLNYTLSCHRSPLLLINWSMWCIEHAVCLRPCPVFFFYC